MISSIGVSMPILWIYLTVIILTQYLCINSVFVLATECSLLTVTLVVTLRKFASLVLKLVSVGEKIFPRSLEDNFFSHPDNENKLFKAILSGLPQIDTAEIENDSKTTYNIVPSKIVMFTTHSTNCIYSTLTRVK